MRADPSANAEGTIRDDSDDLVATVFSHLRLISSAVACLEYATKSISGRPLVSARPETDLSRYFLGILG